jgi:uncharacterized protein YegL
MGRRKPRTRTRVFVVQDKSGSMTSRVPETISGFNEYIDQLDQQAEGEVLLSLIQFDTNVKNVYVNKNIADVEDLTLEDFTPGGMTALRDGVGRAITTAEKSATADDKILIVIMTDGGENSSVEHSHDAIIKLIESKRKSGWEFVFLGAGEEAWSAGQNVFGGTIPQTHMINYGVMDSADHFAGYSALVGSTVSMTRGGGAAFDPNVKISLESKAKAEVKK